MSFSFLRSQYACTQLINRTFKERLKSSVKKFLMRFPFTRTTILVFSNHKIHKKKLSSRWLFFLFVVKAQENYQKKHQPIQMNIEMILKIFFMKKIILKDFIQLHPFSKWRRGKKWSLKHIRNLFQQSHVFFLHINFFMCICGHSFFRQYINLLAKKNFITARWEKVTREFQTSKKILHQSWVLGGCD